MSPSLEKLSLDLFRTFVCFAQVGRVEDVADQLGMTQAAVSLQLKKLEAEVGQPLFQMVGRRKLLTEFAQSLFQTLAPPLNSVQSRLKEASISLNQLTDQMLRIAGPAESLLSFAQKKLAGKKSSLISIDEPGALAMLRDGQCDLALLSEDPMMKGFSAKLFSESGFKLVIHRSLLRTHKLNLVDLIQQPQRLGQLPYAHAESPITTVDKVGEYVGDSANMPGKSLDMIVSSSNFDLLTKMMELTPSWSVLPSSVSVGADFEEHLIQSPLFPSQSVWMVYPSYLQASRKFEGIV